MHRLKLPIVPDWVQTMTAAEAEEELTGFKFNGPGWYLTCADTVLVLPDGERYRFCIYGDRNPMHLFAQIARLTVRSDTRWVHELEPEIVAQAVETDINYFGE